MDPNALQFEDLGIYPESIEESAIKVLRKHRADRFFDLGIDDIEPAPTVKWLSCQSKDITENA